MNANAYTQHAPLIGRRLWALAVHWSRSGMPDTQAKRESAIKAIKVRKKIPGGIRGARLAVEAAVESLNRERSANRRYRYRLFCDEVKHPRGCLPNAAGKNLGEEWSFLRVAGTPRSAGPGLQTGPLRSRLFDRIERTIIDRVHQCYNLTVAGSETYTVVLTTDPKQVGASTHTYKDFSDQYRGRFKGWAKTALRCYINVPRAWISRVLKRRLDVCSGMLTLDAQRLDCSEPDIEVFAAVWIVQGRGKSLRTERGFIARTRDYRHAFHAGTYAACVSGLRRKLRADQATPEDRKRKAEAQVARFAARWASSTMLCTIEDAEAIGACRFGIESWCHAVGLDDQLAVGQATAAELAAGYAVRPLPEVRQTILYAARRQADRVAE